MANSKQLMRKINGAPRSGSAFLDLGNDLAAYETNCNGWITPVSNTRASIGMLLATKPVCVMEKVNQTRKMREKYRNMGNEIPVWPNTVVYCSTTNAFYKFERFTEKFAVFTKISVNLDTMRIRG